jgi:hypothetical protein
MEENNNENAPNIKLNKNVTAQDFLKALQSAPDVEPEEFDRL